MPDRTIELDPLIIRTALGKNPSATADAQRLAFAELYEHYEPRVRYAVARAAMKTFHRHQIDDLRQEVWCRFSRCGGGVLRYYDATRGQFGPFISRVAYQQAIEVARRSRRQTIEIGASDSFEDELEDPRMGEIFAQFIQHDFYDKLLARAKDDLDDDDMILLREIYLEGRNCQMVARDRDINKHTIYKHHLRLKRKLGKLALELLRTPTSDPWPQPTAAAVLMVLLASLSPAPDGEVIFDVLDPFASRGDSDA